MQERQGRPVEFTLNALGRVVIGKHGVPPPQEVSLSPSPSRQPVEVPVAVQADPDPSREAVSGATGDSEASSCVRTFKT